MTRPNARNDFIVSRPIMRSKGIITEIPVEYSSPNLHGSLRIRPDEHNKVKYFSGVQWLVKKVSRCFITLVGHVLLIQKQGDEAKLNHAGGVCEVASESTFETARTRGFGFRSRDLKFSETIVTVNYDPGGAQWAAFRKDDFKLIDQMEICVSQYTYYSAKIAKTY